MTKFLRCVLPTRVVSEIFRKYSKLSISGVSVFSMSVLAAVVSLNCVKKDIDDSEPVAFETAEIFSPVEEHTHGSTIVELPGNDLLAAWFQGSGERWADDVRIMGSRFDHKNRRWTAPFLMADVPDFPDVNPVMFLDPGGRLWLVWYTVIANQWETSLIMYRTSDDYSQTDGPPKWQWQNVILVKPGDKTERGIQPGDSFVLSVQNQVEAYAEYLRKQGYDQEMLQQWYRWGERMLAGAMGDNMQKRGRLFKEDGSYSNQTMGYPYFRRMGWQTKNKAVFVNERLILPLYSDGFSFSLMAITDDGGSTWQFSEPLVGAGNIQPSIAHKSDGTLTAYMRDNGPAPKKMHMSHSHDNGLTWETVRDSDLPNPGSGSDLVTLDNGHWVMAYNDTEQGRRSLAISISTDEGETWTYTRHLESESLNNGVEVNASYPAIIQSQDGSIIVTYSYHYRNNPDGRDETIKYARFDETWIMAGDEY
jgi:predicted neuraminidase